MEMEYIIPEEEKCMFEIYDANGKILYSQQLAGGSGKLPISIQGLKSGVYYYRAFTPNHGLVNDMLMIIK